MDTYTVLMLGPSGSGKTVFLASMFQQLSIQGEEGFFIKLNEAEKRKRLNQIYLQIAAEDDTWPRGTQLAEVSKWDLTICVQTKDLPIYPACQFTYLDYSGSRLTDEMNDPDPEFDDQLQKADALLGLLDGHKILNLMKNGKAGTIFALKELPNMLQLMQRCQVNNPVHFIISKWDLLENEFSLKQIRDRLLQIENFRRLIQNRKNAGASVRLIPISSVGAGFAVLQPDGRMKKMGILPRPFQIEMPISCVVPDIIQYKLKELEEQRKSIISQSVVVKPNLTFLDKLCLIVTGVFNERLPKTNSIQMIIDFLRESPRQKEEDASRRSEQLQRQKDASLKEVQDEQTALNYAILCFVHIGGKLDSKFPESSL